MKNRKGRKAKQQRFKENGYERTQKPKKWFGAQSESEKVAFHSCSGSDNNDGSGSSSDNDGNNNSIGVY